MKKLFVSILLSVVCIVCMAQPKTTSYFTISDSFGTVKQFVVNDEFIAKFASFSRERVPQEYRIWMNDIYRALQNGATIIYNQDNNTILGMTGKWHVKDESKLSSGRSVWNKFWDAQFESEAHQFRDALVYLKYLVNY